MLDKFFAPSSVAVIGASRDKKKVGYSILNNLLRFGYKGKIYPVNPKAEKIEGLKAYPSILDIKSPVDLCIIVTIGKVQIDFITSFVKQEKKKSIAQTILDIILGIRKSEGKISILFFNINIQLFIINSGNKFHNF